MSEPFLAEIKIIGFNFAPRGWAYCDGQILPINQNQSLYSLLGTTYGGDGRSSFALPDLRGRVPIHVGNANGMSHTLGQRSGEETHTLWANEMPNHDHVLKGTANNADSTSASGRVLANSAIQAYHESSPSPPTVNMRAGVVANVGGGQAHENMQPYITLGFVIALQGLFPSRN